MNILAISHEYPPIGGGGSNACLFLLRGFVKRGHKATLVTSGFVNLPEKETTKDGVVIYRVPSKRANKEHCSFSEMFDFLKKAKKFSINLCRKENFDIALIFFGIPSGPIGVSLKRKFNLPFIIRFGGGDIPGFQDRFKSVYKLLGPSIKNIWKTSDARVANSEGLRKLAYDFYDKEKFEVIPNGVDSDTFKPDDMRVSGKVFKVLFVSRLIERKGLQFVIPQLPALRDELEAKGKGLRLTIVGDGPYRDTLEVIAKEHGVSDIIDFVGQKDKDQIVPYYQDADVFILPSKKEGMPNVVLEAMACGLPIVMTPCQGSDELIKDNGFVCKAKDFGEKLRILAFDDAQRRLMGLNSGSRVRSNFTWDATTDKYINLMKEILSKKGK